MVGLAQLVRRGQVPLVGLGQDELNGLRVEGAEIVEVGPSLVDVVLSTF